MKLVHLSRTTAQRLSLHDRRRLRYTLGGPSISCVHDCRQYCITIIQHSCTFTGNTHARAEKRKKYNKDKLNIVTVFIKGKESRDLLCLVSPHRFNYFTLSFDFTRTFKIEI